VKDTKGLVARLEKQGWTITMTGSNHYRVTPPPGLLARDGSPSSVVFLAYTPSDYRGQRNALSLLRRQGADL
jgi:hypothetical protein